MNLQRPVTAKRIIDVLCVPEGEKAGAWKSERKDDHMFHAGIVPSIDGPEFVAAVGGFAPGNPIRLLPQGGDWPYVFALASDAEQAMILYCEGDIGVRVYDTARAFRRGVAAYEEGPPWS